MEHAVPSENFQRENGTTFSEVQFCPEIFQWNKSNNRVPFPTHPKFPESLKLDKWKTPAVYIYIFSKTLHTNKQAKPCLTFECEIIYK